MSVLVNMLRLKPLRGPHLAADQMQVVVAVLAAGCRSVKFKFQQHVSILSY